MFEVGRSYKSIMTDKTYKCVFIGVSVVVLSSKDGMEISVYKDDKCYKKHIEPQNLKFFVVWRQKNDGMWYKFSSYENKNAATYAGERSLREGFKAFKVTEHEVTFND